jgi:hypothetical protein
VNGFEKIAVAAPFNQLWTPQRARLHTYLRKNNGSRECYQHSPEPDQIAFTGGNMASPTVPVSSASPQQNRLIYAGELISSLIATVERVEQVPLSHLTIDEVLDRSRRSR